MKRNYIPYLVGACAYLACHSSSIAAVVFVESVGVVGGTTTVVSHVSNGGFDNDAFTFSGSGDIRATSASSGYTGASGSANVYLTNSGSANFRIDGISTMGHVPGSVGISFGAYKSSMAADMTTLLLEYSTDGALWSAIGIPAQATGSGTANWRLISFSETDIPISSSLSLRWTSTDTTTQYRIDDITLTAIPEPSVAFLSGFGLLALLRRRR
jgi:hypothetical protein